MNTTALKSQASFRWQTSLIDELKELAKSSNRSFNNYVESLLIGILHPTQTVPLDVAIPSQQMIDRTESICQGLREIRMIKDGKLKNKSADELFNEL